MHVIGCSSELALLVILFYLNCVIYMLLSGFHCPLGGCREADQASRSHRLQKAFLRVASSACMVMIYSRLRMTDWHGDGAERYGALWAAAEGGRRSTDLCSGPERNMAGEGCGQHQMVSVGECVILCLVLVRVCRSLNMCLHVG